MKKIMLYVLLFLSPLCIKASADEKPIVCLNMIVKNESEVIKRCLESTLPLIDYWVIVDTGSSDETKEIIKEFMKDIPGELYERSWVNFEHNRNEALELAKDKAEYLLFIDADDKLDIPAGYVRPELTLDGYYFKIDFNGNAYYRPHLVRTDLDWQWTGVVHEGLFSNWAQTISVLDQVTMIIIGGGDRSKDEKKCEKDAEMLEQALKIDPTNARNVFYLAQSYRDSGQLKRAIENYERRATMGDFDQEIFWSLYQIGCIQEKLEMPDETVCKSYSKAYNFRPTRAEPLYRLASYYRIHGDHLMGYLSAQIGLSVAPTSDTLFIESWIYDYGLLLEFSICAYWMGRYDEALVASNALLAKKTLPENVRECVETNLIFIHAKLENKENTFFFKITE